MVFTTDYAIAQRTALGAEVESLDIGRHFDIESAGSLTVDHQGLRELLQPGRVSINGAEWKATKVHRVRKGIDALTHEGIRGNLDDRC